MKKEVCKNCTYYSAYYKQWSSHYTRLDKGFCSKHQKIIKQYEICEDFKSNELKEKMREKRRMDALEQALISINEIAQILKEKQSDKLNP